MMHELQEQVSVTVLLGLELLDFPVRGAIVPFSRDGLWDPDAALMD